MSEQPPWQDRPELPRSRSGRIPTWVLDEALGTPQDALPWRAPTRSLLEPEHRTPSVPRLGHRGVVAALCLSLVILSGLGPARGWVASLPGVPTGVLPGGLARASDEYPTPGREVADEPLGTPPTLPVTSGSYRFMAGGAGDAADRPAVAYDPCRPVHYVVRPGGAPPGGDALIAEAVARVSAATGLVFVADGTTSENPSPQRRPYQPDLYGDRWAPVLVAWVSADESPDLAGGVAGQAGSQIVGLADGRTVYVTGQVELDGQQLAQMLAAPGGADSVRAVIQHELAHLVGLAHVNDPTQLMHPTGTGITDFAAGDRTGLALLGRGECVAEL